MYFTNAQWLPFINHNYRVEQRRYLAAALESQNMTIPGYPTGHAAYLRRSYYDQGRMAIPECPEFTPEQAAFVLEKAEAAIRDRDFRGEWINCGLTKWIRPWDVVPELKQFKVPKDDFGVGIEVEMGFNSTEDARFFTHHMKDWQHVTFDLEGGSHPIEVTFPPSIYSEMNSRSLPFRYMRYLKKNEDRVYPHNLHDGVGTHINVSKGGVDNYNPDGRLSDLNKCLSSIIKNKDLSYKYFGRIPYGLAFNQGRWVEFKLFNSQTSDRRLRQYIDIGVSLIELVVGKLDTPVTIQNVHIALEEGFCKSLKIKPVVDSKATEGMSPSDYSQHFPVFTPDSIAA